MNRQDITLREVFIAESYQREIDQLKSKLDRAVEALEFIANDLDQIGITPTEISHLAKAKNALQAIKESK